MRAALVAMLLCSGSGCALVKPALRTALDVAREACDVFLSQRAEAAADDQMYGMSLDQCAEILLSAQQAQIQAGRAGAGQR